MLNQFLSAIQSNSIESNSKPTTLEKLEQCNSDNASERHLLEFEENFDNDKTASIGKELSSTVLAGSVSSFILLRGIESITIDFNPIPLGLLMFAASCITATITSDNQHKLAYKLLMGFAKITISAAINGSLLGSMNSKYHHSVQVVDSIQSEIKRYENGYKSSPFSWETIFMVIAILGLISYVIYGGNGSKSNE